MIKRSTKNKIYKIFLYVISLSFILIIIFIILKGNRNDLKYSAMIDTNNLQILGLEMVYIIDDKTYVNLISEKAFANRDTFNVDLHNLKMQYNSKENSVTVYADKGIYESQRILRAKGNIKGVMDNLDFYTKDNGELIYDYKSGTGVINNGITLKQGSNLLNSEKAEFNVNNNYILFVNNVIMEYMQDSVDIIEGNNNEK